MTSLRVRPMALADLDVRIRYFHEATDEHLQILGVDRTKLSSLEEWSRSFEDDLRRPLEQRGNYGLIWESDGRTIGFSTADRIEFGVQAFMHLHLLRPEDRSAGRGTELVRQSADVFVDLFRLKHLFCEPHAFNVAPNRTLQRAGFEYLSTQWGTPAALNFEQVTNLWVFGRDHRSRLALTRDGTPRTQAEPPPDVGVSASLRGRTAEPSSPPRVSRH